MKYRCLGLLLAVLFVPSLAGAAEYSSQILVDSCDELRAYELSYDLGLGNEEFELLKRLCKRPLDLNRADRDMLKDLPGVHFDLAENIVEYRSATGGFQSILDLLQVEGMSEVVFQGLRIFVTASDDYAPSVDAEHAIKGRSKIATGYTVGSGRTPKDQEKEDAKNFGPQSYLKLNANILDTYGFGLVATHRVRTSAEWDPSIGFLNSDGPGKQLDLDSIFVTGRDQEVSWIVGSFQAGFGEKLVFDRSHHTIPKGWYPDNQINFSSSQYRKPQLRSGGLFGAAVTFEGADVANGWVDTTLFASYKVQDIYQYSYRYGFDDYHTSDRCPDGDCGEEPQCQSDSECPLGYKCGDNLMCYSTLVGGGIYQTIQDAYGDAIVGGNSTYNWNEYNRIGITLYRGQSVLYAAAEANPEFAPAYDRPMRDVYGAVGLNGVVGGPEGELAAALALTDRGAPAGVVRGSWLPTRGLTLEATGYYYSHLYDNPFSGGAAGTDLTDGATQRNEVGFELGVSYQPIKELRMKTDLDVYHRLMLDAWRDDGVQVWFPNEADVWGAVLHQSVWAQIAKKEYVRVDYWLRDRNLGAEGYYYDNRVASYSADGYSALMTEEEARRYVQDTYVTSKPGGTSNRFKVTGGTKRFFKTNLAIDYKLKTFKWARSLSLAAGDEDSASVDGSFDGRYVEHQFALRATGPLWKDARFRATMSWATGDTCGDIAVDGGDAAPANVCWEGSVSIDGVGGYSEVPPYFRALLGVTQKIPEFGAVSLSYTGESYDKESYYGHYNKLMFWLEANI